MERKALLKKYEVHSKVCLNGKTSVDIDLREYIIDNVFFYTFSDLWLACEKI